MAMDILRSEEKKVLRFNTNVESFKFYTNRL